MSAEERRSKNKLQDEEDAAILKLGDFDGKNCLSISEVMFLLQTSKINRLERNIKLNDTAVYKKTEEYVTSFARFTTKESVNAVRDILTRITPILSQFEQAQIANLCPTEAEEAKALIPSLSKMDDDDLQSMLSEISHLRRFQ